MINYSTYNDAWGVNPNSSKNMYDELSNKKSIKSEQFTSEDDYCYKCDNIDKILNCDKCLNKLKEKLGLVEKFNSETFNSEKNDCNNYDRILNDDEFLNKLKVKLESNQKIENFSNSFKIKETFKNKIEGFNNNVKDFLLIFCDTPAKKKLLLALLVLLFLILSFLFIEGRGVETKETNIEDLTAVLNDQELGNMKYFTENFIMIPKKMINFNNLVNPN